MTKIAITLYQTKKTVVFVPISTKESIAYLVSILEASHPDTYSGFGGKVFFHKQAFKKRRKEFAGMRQSFPL